MNLTIDDFFILVAAAAIFIAYPICLRIELNYFKKHRKELTQLLYGHDPFESETKLYWSDHMIMSVGIFFGLHMAWRHNNNMRISKDGLLVFAPNIMENHNYLTLTKNHPRLKSFWWAFVLIGLIGFGSAGIAYFLKA